MADNSTSNAIQKQINAAVDALNRDVAVQKQFGHGGDVGLQNAYNALNGQLNTNLGEIKTNVATGRNDISSTYDASRGNITNAETTLRELLGSDNESNMGPLAEVQRLLAEQDSAKANSVASFNTLGLGHTNAGQQAIGDARREGVQQRGDLRSQIGAQISDLQAAALKERSALEVQYAQVLADERYKSEQMALQRAQLASETAARSAASQRYTGKQGVEQWAAANGISEEMYKTIMSAVSQAQQQGDPGVAYELINKSAPGFVYRAPKSGSPIKSLTGRYKPRAPMSIDQLTTGVDIYFGNYASYAN